MYQPHRLIAYPSARGEKGYIYGFDNAKQKHVQAWIDNFGTLIMMGEGTADEAGTITYHSEMDMGGMVMKMPGRVGDTAVIGGGSYCGPAGAVTSTSPPEGYEKVRARGL